MKAKYRIKWDYGLDGEVVGYWVFTCNVEAAYLHESFYVVL